MEQKEKRENRIPVLITTTRVGTIWESTGAKHRWNLQQSLQKKAGSVSSSKTREKEKLVILVDLLIFSMLCVRKTERSEKGDKIWPCCSWKKKRGTLVTKDLSLGFFWREVTHFEGQCVLHRTANRVNSVLRACRKTRPKGKKQRWQRCLWRSMKLRTKKRSRSSVVQRQGAVENRSLWQSYRLRDEQTEQPIRTRKGRAGKMRIIIHYWHVTFQEEKGWLMFKVRT